MIEQKPSPIMGSMKPFSQFIFTCIMVFSMGFVFQLAATFIASLIFHTPILEIFDSAANSGEGNVAALKFIQILGAIGTFIFSSFLLSRLYTGNWFAFFTLNLKPSMKASLIIVLIMIVALPSVNYLTELNLKMELPFPGLEAFFMNMQEQTEGMMMTMLKADNAWALMVNIFMIAIIPAVGEELVFRGLLQKHLSFMFKNIHFAIILAAAIFSIVHMQIYAFLPRFFLGLILGYLFYYGKSIWYPIIAHLVNNTMGVVFYYYQLKGDSVDAMEDIGTQSMLPYISLLSLVMVGVLMYLWISLVQPNRSFQPGRAERDEDH